MIVTVMGAGDAEVDPGTPLEEVLATLGSPDARWCGDARLDPGHRAGLAPLVNGALLTHAPGAPPTEPAGPRLRVIAGPDAGGIVAPTGAWVAWGRDGMLAAADPRLSGRHLAVDGRGRARDLGSANGTTLVRRGRRRRLGRWGRRLRAGDLLEAGASVLVWEAPGVDPGGDGRPAQATARGPTLLAGLAGGAAGALALAVATGRWWLALTALAVPAAVGAQALAARRGPDPEPRGVDALADLPAPVAVVGEGRRARAVVRALALARAEAPPGELAEPWARWLPARMREGTVTVDPAGAPRSDAATVIDADAGTLAVRGRDRPWEPALVGEAAAELAARRLASRAPASLPHHVRWAGLGPPVAGVAVTLGVDAHGPVTLDLDRDGPHLLVAGTTGSGKSALLETVVAALAHGLPPAAVTFALLDLKGGAGLRTCAALPHCAGVLTDLEPGSARRALLGIAHELRRRKRLLADAGLSSWDQWDAGAAPPRLVAVVDEFQELGSLDPGLVPELARIASQGRSLGLHLLLATQRPAGAVTPQIRANVGTVIALRTATAGESHDLLGDAAAAALPADAPGRAVMATPRGRTVVQAALPLAEPLPRVRPADAGIAPGRRLTEAAAARWADAGPGEPLWLPPLAASEPPPGALGWLDLPATRDRRPLAWDLAAGPLIVVGPRGSGRTSVLDAVSRCVPGSVRLPEDPREAARTVELARRSPPAALLVDDAERACAALDAAAPGGAQALEDLARAVPLALTCGPGWGARWAPRAGLRIVLAGLDRVEQALWGVPPDLGAVPAEPGRGVAIGTAGVGECLVALVPPAPGVRLVAPLTCPAGLPGTAAGVAGDAAAPLVLPAAGVVVVGEAGPAVDDARARLAAAGVRATVSPHPPGPGASCVVVDPEPARLRALGLRAEPGVADPLRPPGRVAVRVDGATVAAQLRPRRSARAERVAAPDDDREADDHADRDRRDAEPGADADQVGAREDLQRLPRQRGRHRPPRAPAQPAAGDGEPRADQAGERREPDREGRLGQGEGVDGVRDARRAERGGLEPDAGGAPRAHAR